MSIITIMDLFKINESILKRVSRELAYHGLETAYTVYQIAQKLEYDEERIYKLTALAFLHDIGAYKTDTVAQLESFHIAGWGKHSIYGYALLKHTLLFEEESSIVLYHHHSYEKKDNLINNIPIPEDAFLISLADSISLCFNIFKYNEPKIVEYIENIDKNRFNKIHIEKLIELVKDKDLINEIVSGRYVKFLKDEFASKINMSKYKLEKYIVLLLLAIDFFSYETSLHTIGVSCITEQICEKMNLEEEYIQKIKMGAYLHDLGKVCTPKYILEKEGKLSTEEYEIMKKHVEYSREILEDAGIDKEIIDLACNHHEKLDGTGYPKKLDAQSLTIGQRIISIGDIFCALTEKRHYKSAFSKDKVIDILSDMISKNYIDKNIVAVLINNYEEILENLIKEREEFEYVLNNMMSEYRYILAQMK